MSGRAFWRVKDNELRLKLTTAKRNLVKLGYEHICGMTTMLAPDFQVIA
jgi:hypothetical protein